MKTKQESEKMVLTRKWWAARMLEQVAVARRNSRTVYAKRSGEAGEWRLSAKMHAALAKEMLKACGVEL